MCDVVACDVFDGFEGQMSPDAARERVGTPSGRWLDPWYRVDAPYYDRPEGRVSLCRAPDSGGYHWETVAYPQDPTCHSVFRNVEARSQILQIARSGGMVRVHVLRSVGWGGISVSMSGGGCDKLILTAQESESGPPNKELQRTRPPQAVEPRR